MWFEASGSPTFTLRNIYIPPIKASSSSCQLQALLQNFFETMGMYLVHSLPILLLFSLLPLVTPIRLDLTHIDAGVSFSKLELLQRTVLRSKHRISNITRTRTPVHPDEQEYLVDLKMGTPPRQFSVILDSGSDLIWTQCAPCVKCVPQNTTLFDPSQSSTYSELPCNSTLCEALLRPVCRPQCIYVMGYGDGTFTQGVLSSEIFTFGSETAQLGFGCGKYNQGDLHNASGIVGIGGGPLSLISQLGVGEFSYCFTSFLDSKKSPFFLGPISNRQIHKKSTPLLKNPLKPTYYYLSLLGITVGHTRLNIPRETFELKEDGSGGVVIDSGTTVTHLEASAYKLVKKAFVDQVKLPVVNGTVDLDLCFALPVGSTTYEMPKLVFHFEGADWVLTRKNYFVEQSGLYCLTIQEMDGMSIFGNMQQQDTYIRYDLKKKKLSFGKARCDKI